MRNIFYRVELQLSNGKVMPITIATKDRSRLPELIEKHKVIYNRPEYIVTGFALVDERYTIQMDEPTYQNELAYCDIVDDTEEQQANLTGKVSYNIGTMPFPPSNNGGIF